MRSKSAPRLLLLLLLYPGGRVPATAEVGGALSRAPQMDCLQSRLPPQESTAENRPRRPHVDTIAGELAGPDSLASSERHRAELWNGQDIRHCGERCLLSPAGLPAGSDGGVSGGGAGTGDSPDPAASATPRSGNLRAPAGIARAPFPIRTVGGHGRAMSWMSRRAVAHQIPSRLIGPLGKALANLRRDWERTKIELTRACHLPREVKALFSSELERCFLKATRPESAPVTEACMLKLLGQANKLVTSDEKQVLDPYNVVCSKAYKKLMERDWRTIAKTLYVVHRLQRDSPPRPAAKMSSFYRENWADGASQLGEHMRKYGGVHAPWLKLYSVYLAGRGRRVDTVTAAFRSWESLTSMRQLHNAVVDLHSLAKSVVALHFAGDTLARGSGSGGSGRLLAACGELAYQDMTEVQALLSGTGPPPALLGVMDVPVARRGGAADSGGAEPCEESGESAESTGVLQEDMTAAAGHDDVPSGAPKQQQRSGVWGFAHGFMSKTGTDAELSAGTESEASVALESSREEPGGGGESRDGALEVEDGPSAGPNSMEPVLEEKADPSDQGVTTSAGDVRAAVADVNVVGDMAEDVLAVAKECAAYVEVCGVINSVYSERYGKDLARSAPRIPQWVRQMAELAHQAREFEDAQGQPSMDGTTQSAVGSSLRGGGSGAAAACGGFSYGASRSRLSARGCLSSRVTADAASTLLREGRPRSFRVERC